jgi:hypothetical protein
VKFTPGDDEGVCGPRGRAASTPGGLVVSQDWEAAYERPLSNSPQHAPAPLPPRRPAQGDPYAAPSRLRVRVSPAAAGLPAHLYESRVRRVALRDYLARRFAAGANTATRQVGPGGWGAGCRGAAGWAPPRGWNGAVKLRSPWRMERRAPVDARMLHAWIVSSWRPSPLPRPRRPRPHPHPRPQNQQGWHGAKGGDVSVDAPGAPLAWAAGRTSKAAGLPAAPRHASASRRGMPVPERGAGAVSWRGVGLGPGTAP